MKAQDYFKNGDFSEVEGSEDSSLPSNLVDLSDETIMAVIDAYLEGKKLWDIKLSVKQDDRSLSLNQVNQIILATEAQMVELAI